MTGLRALEAVARHGTLTAAARELFVTPAAVSHRLRDLEDRAAAKLLYRDSGLFYPTATGRAVLEQLGDAFERIRNANRIVEDASAAPPLHIVASYSFAVSWMIPNLQDFQSDFPTAKISIDTSHNPIRQSRKNPGLVIVHADTRPEGDGWVHLFEDICGVVCKVGHPLLKQDSPIVLQQLTHYPLVHISHEQGSRRGEFSWQEWAMRLNLENQVFPVGVQITAEHAGLELVQTNESLTLVSLVNADRILRSGSACLIKGTAVRSGRSYWCRPDKETNQKSPAIIGLQNWLARKTAETLARYCL